MRIDDYDERLRAQALKVIEAAGPAKRAIDEALARPWYRDIHRSDVLALAGLVALAAMLLFV